MRLRYEALLVFVVLGFGCAVYAVDPAFLSWRVQSELTGLVWELALVALAMTLIVLTGGIDLSVGAVMSLSAVAFGLGAERGLSPVVCAMSALLAGAVAGLANGLLVTRLKVHPLIVTLATMSAYFGLAEGASHARPISGFPPAFAHALTGAVPAVVVVLAAIGAALFLAGTATGQAVHAIGMNETAVRFSGIRVDRIKVWLYAFAGSAAGTAALFYAARRNTVKADIGRGFELDVVTAVVLGGTSIYGGRGSVLGTLLGVVLVHEVRQFVSWRWERDELNLIVMGGVLVASVLVHTALNKRNAGTRSVPAQNPP